jgi:MOSC domain-containing protein YiiM
MKGWVEAIQICPAGSEPMRAVAEATAVVDAGLEGDRYAAGTGFYSPRPRPDGGRQLTLIEAETLAALSNEHGIALSPAESRRNITTRGIGLNDLIGVRFTIGEVECEGVDLCPPCVHLEEVTGKPVLAPLVGRGGLRARIVTGGTIRVGDQIVMRDA